MNLSYELMNTLKEIAVSAISTAKDISDTIHDIVDYRVGICPFNVISAMNITDTLLPHGVAQVSFQFAQRTE